tara:strand:+ start:21 stop:488 length:468 start_codon:yes stop_codon:yes gene_type:complete
MNIKLIVIGKTNSKDLKQLIDLYTAKLKFYINFELVILKDQKSKTQKNIQIKEEGEKIISVLKKNDFIVILDENGQHKSSLEFSEFIQKKLNSGMKTLTFIIGGPYGFSEKIKMLSNQQLSLSKMTFSHEMVRLFFTEQLYRAFSILNNEPYHHK